MRMTPLDIQSHRFRRAWNGADPEEVEGFLRAVADDYEALIRESESRADQIRRLELRLEELSLNEALLKETLVSAQNLGDELRRSAKKEAEVMVSEAEIKAEKILDAAHRRAARLAEEIRELRGLRARLASALRASIGTHLALVDALSMEADEAAALESQLSYLEAREATATRPPESRAPKPEGPAPARSPQTGSTPDAGDPSKPAEDEIWEADPATSSIPTATRRALRSSST